MKRVYRRFSAADYIIFGLLALGILARFVQNPGPFLIPFLVFGTIFLLYKFPPNRIRSFTLKRQSNIRYREKERRKSRFHVIRGNKHPDDEEPPRYH